MADRSEVAFALEIAANGYRVFPLNGKQPARGCLWSKVASSTPAEVLALFDRHPDHNGVGIFCGESGVAVVDFDTPPEATGLELDPPAWKVDTPRGGQHWFYAADPDHPLSVSASKLAPGVDVRAGHGYVRAYDVPPPVAELTIVPPIVWQRAGALAAPAEQPVAAPAGDLFGLPDDAWGGHEPDWCVAKAREWVEAARNTPEGAGFNHALNQAALQVGKLVGAGLEGWSEARAEQALNWITDRWPAPDATDRATWRSGYEKGLSEPWKIRQSAGKADADEASASTVDPVAALRARLLDRDALDALPAPRPLIRDVLDLDSESWVIGAPGEFKSFVALDWACHVALGLAWRGKPVTQGTVVYVAAEGSKGIPLRVKAWEETYGKRAEGVLFLPEPVQVANAVAWGALIEVCREIGPVLIVLDTQARITVGVEENSSTAMGVLTEAVRRLKAATGACVLVVHHTGRNGADARGSSAIDGVQDTEMKVSRPRPKVDREALLATISTDKQKDSDESVSFDVQLRKVDLGTDAETDRPLSSLALIPLAPFGTPAPKRPEPDWSANLTVNQDDVVSAMRDHSDEYGATRAQVIKWIKLRREEQGRPAMADTSFDSAVRGLVKAPLELIRKVKGPRLVLTELIEDDEK